MVVNHLFHLRNVSVFLIRILCWSLPAGISMFLAEHPKLIFLLLYICNHITGRNIASFGRCVLALTVLVATIDAQWEGMGDVGLARYEPALLPPCPTIRVLSYSN